MCPACILTIGGGLLIAKKLGINDVLSIGLITIFLSAVTNILLRKINKEKVFFPYQRVVISLLLLLIAILIFRTIK
ncbi:hypothetical protein CO165_04380 [Candidatus Roizmanbacteria bacterium CG_4_9_14_3_um_filter_33_18]|uniref:Uncharacterized protein n=2 Tax=Candidatus Roizmaniibacteriota TaxID=1752723 RepID=A0A2M7U894_9BACT|nr:MAG: hypothetical protein COY12_01935 [Candidatus Roizmanbacteria bacterium CG_4_10_14_0_2_um_filter_33_96]PJA55279.1 MAG: hypothetical protein CO165_04380 [Candidatus Roizmanbacteria bacterium CG_4_9_14_3_um_filter_33_18]